MGSAILDGLFEEQDKEGAKVRAEEKAQELPSANQLSAEFLVLMSVGQTHRLRHKQA